MTRIILLSILINISLLGRSESKVTFIEYKNETDLIRKANFALELWAYYNRFDVDSLNVLGVSLKKSKRGVNDSFVKGVWQRILGSFDVKKGFLKEGLTLLKSSRSIFINLGDNRLISEAFNETGIGYLLLSDFQHAKENFNSSMEFGNYSGSVNHSYLAMINLAQCYQKDGDFISAKLYANKYTRYALDGEKFESAANGYSFLGQISMDENKLDKAIIFFNKQMEYAQKCSAPLILTRAKNNLAITLFLQGKSKEALQLFQEVLSERKAQGVIIYLCDAYLNLGELYIEIHDSETSKKYLDSSIHLAEKHGLITNHIEALEMCLSVNESTAVKNEILVLKSKQKRIRVKQRNERKLKSVPMNNKITSGNLPWYIYLVFFIIPIVLYMFFRKSLSDEG